MKKRNTHACAAARSILLPVARLVATLGLGAQGLLLHACASDQDQQADSEHAAHELEHLGLTFDRRGPAIEQQVPPGSDAIVPPRELSEQQTVAKSLKSSSRAELADALRPAFVDGSGSVYVAREPNWEAAEAVLSGDEATSIVEMLNDVAEAVPDSSGDDEAPSDDKRIIGPDGRRWVSNAAVSPYHSVAQLAMFTGSTYRTSCSGVYIGSSTLITSAHCLVYSNTDRANRIMFYPRRNGSSAPFRHDCRLDDASRTNDFRWTVPSGYLTGQQESLDFAVIHTLPCHAPPSFAGSFVTNAGNGNFRVAGYPADRCPGAPTTATSLCTSFGSAYLNEWRIESEFIDIMPGDSGGPWFSGSLPAGVSWGYRVYPDLFRCGLDVCRRNFSRRIDNAFADFIRQSSGDF